MTCRSYMPAIQAARTVEDFICAVADVTDFEQDNSDFVTIEAHWRAAIAKAREFRPPMDHSIGRLLDALSEISRIRSDHGLARAREIATQAIREHAE